MADLIVLKKIAYDLCRYAYEVLPYTEPPRSKVDPTQALCWVVLQALADQYAAPNQTNTNDDHAAPPTQRTR